MKKQQKKTFRLPHGSLVHKSSWRAITMERPRVQRSAKQAAVRERKRERDRARKDDPVYRQRNAEAMRIRRQSDPNVRISLYGGKFRVQPSFFRTGALILLFFTGRTIIIIASESWLSCSAFCVYATIFSDQREVYSFAVKRPCVEIPAHVKDPQVVNIKIVTRRWERINTFP